MNIQIRLKNVEDKIALLGLGETVLFVLAKNKKGDFEIPAGFDKKRDTIFVIDSSFRQLDNQKANQL